MKLEIIRLIEDWKKNSDSTIGCYGVEHEIIPTTRMGIGYGTLEDVLTD